jgi:NAD(P)-dependent dehydrogenase (short-subunit alcohol dehydrogenase family)
VVIIGSTSGMGFATAQMLLAGGARAAATRIDDYKFELNAFEVVVLMKRTPDKSKPYTQIRAWMK